MFDRIGERPRYTDEDVKARALAHGLTPPLLNIEVVAITGMLNGERAADSTEELRRFQIVAAGGREGSPLVQDPRSQDLHRLLHDFRLG